jgi:tRNA pseudouridine38-40 synthase
MRHLKLVIQYDGTAYSGWQIQQKETTIQGSLEDAVYSVTGERTRVTGAARTDAGVHAFEQVAALSTLSALSPEILLRALNAHLPDAIRITGAEECPESFHPRYSAKNKIYSYLISRPGAYSVFLQKYSWQIGYSLNLHSIKKAADCLTGKHDFTSFRASGCSSKHPVREIMDIQVSDYESTGFLSFMFSTPLIRISIRANAFLRHMARNIVGTLVDVGRGQTRPEDMKKILESRDRQAAGITAPARGLFLEKIEY